MSNLGKVPPPSEPPPSYQTAVAQASSSTTAASEHEKLAQFEENGISRGASPSSSDGLKNTTSSMKPNMRRVDNILNFKPIVIPQTTAKVMNAFISPFARAYPVELESAMSDEAFVNFIDELNEAFMSSPVFQILGLAGVAMQFDPIGAVNFIGMGVQVGMGVASGVNSYARTYHYVKKMNKTTFRPLGLRARIFSTKKMMHEIGIPEGEQIELPALPEYDEEWDPKAPELDPRRRRLGALARYVADLDWNVAPAKVPDNFIKKMGAWQAQRQENKQRKRQEKRLRKLHRREAKAAAFRTDGSSSAPYDAKRAKAADRLERRGNTQRAQEKYQKKMAKIDRKEAKGKYSGKEGNSKKATKAQEKAVKKRDKYEKRERKHLQKIRWLVITKSDLDASDEDDTREEDIDLGIERAEGASSSSDDSSSDSDTDSLYDSDDDDDDYHHSSNEKQQQHQLR